MATVKALQSTALASDAVAKANDLAYAKGVAKSPKGVLDLTNPAAPELLTSDGQTVVSTPLPTTDAEVPADPPVVAPLVVNPPVNPPVVTG